MNTNITVGITPQEAADKLARHLTEKAFKEFGQTVVTVDIKPPVMERVNTLYQAIIDALRGYRDETEASVTSLQEHAEAEGAIAACQFVRGLISRKAESALQACTDKETELRKQAADSLQCAKSHSKNADRNYDVAVKMVAELAAIQNDLRARTTLQDS